MGVLDAPVTRESLALTDYSKLLPLIADLSNAKNKRCDILAVGDSNIEGYSLTKWDDTLPSQLAVMLRSRWGLPAGGRGFVGPQQDKVNQPFWPEVYSGSFGIASAGYGANMRQNGLTTTGKIVHTVATGGITSFIIHYALYGTGTFYYKIDGGSAVNVVANGTSAVNPTTLAVNLPVTSTIEIGVVSGTVYIGGIQEMKGDENSGIQVHNLGYSGSYASFWNAIANPTSWPLSQRRFAASAAFVSLGGNDGRLGGANQTAAVFKANLLAFISTLKAYSLADNVFAPIILNAMWSMGPAAYADNPWSKYVDAMREIAAADARVVLVDHSTRMYEYSAYDPLGLYNLSAPPHALPKGYALEAMTIAKALDPR